MKEQKLKPKTTFSTRQSARQINPQFHWHQRQASTVIIQMGLKFLPLNRPGSTFCEHTFYSVLTCYQNYLKLYDHNTEMDHDRAPALHSSKYW